MQRYAQIISTGRYIPEKVLTNDDLSRMLREDVGEWLVENVGIRERHLMADNETTSDMLVAASLQALERAGLAPRDLSLIMIATDTPDYISPATASAVQAKLGAVNAGTYDINSACAAWVTALDAAARYIATDTDFRHILVAGGYGMSRFIDWTDKYTCTLFADGAGAVINPPAGFLWSGAAATEFPGPGTWTNTAGIVVTFTVGGITNPNQYLTEVKIPWASFDVATVNTSPVNLPPLNGEVWSAQPCRADSAGNFTKWNPSAAGFRTKPWGLWTFTGAPAGVGDWSLY